MPDSAPVRKEAMEGVVADLLITVPLLRKKFLSLDELKAKEGLPLTHVELLAALMQDGAITVSEIASRFQIAKPNITPLIDRLIRADLVERIRSEEDKRVVYVVIKENGRALLRDFCEEAAERMLGWRSRLSDQDYHDLETACNRVAEIIGRATGR